MMTSDRFRCSKNKKSSSFFSLARGLNRVPSSSSLLNDHDKVNAMKNENSNQCHDIQRPYLILFCAAMLGVLTSTLIG